MARPNESAVPTRAILIRSPKGAEAVQAKSLSGQGPDELNLTVQFEQIGLWPRISEAMPSSQTQSAEFTARDLREVAGLSYRQLNDWESKGALVGNREGREGWRKFNAREVFALMVCAEIRQQFGVPLETLGWVRSFMLQEGADHFSRAVELIAEYGLAVWLLTDLRHTFIMDSDLEMEDLLHRGFSRGEDSTGFILLPINPLVNRLLKCHKPPIQLKEGKDFSAVTVRRSHGKTVGLVRRSTIKFKNPRGSRNRGRVERRLNKVSGEVGATNSQQ